MAVKHSCISGRRRQTARWDVQLCQPLYRWRQARHVSIGSYVVDMTCNIIISCCAWHAAPCCSPAGAAAARERCRDWLPDVHLFLMCLDCLYGRRLSARTLLHRCTALRAHIRFGSSWFVDVWTWTMDVVVLSHLLRALPALHEATNFIRRACATRKKKNILHRYLLYLHLHTASLDST